MNQTTHAVSSHAVSSHPVSRHTTIPLGDSGLAVAPLGWGMWRFAGVDCATAQRRVEAAIEIGCTLFDTADIYGFATPAGFGGAERLLGEVLRAAPTLRASIVLATKGGIRPPVPYDSRAIYLIEACENSLRRLGVDCIDLYQIHRPDLLTHPQEVATALDRLRQSGKIRAAGVSNYTVAQIEALCSCLPFGLASVQPEFSPLAIGTMSEGILDLAMRRRLAVLAWSPLAQGRLGTGPRDANSDEREWAVNAILDRVAKRAAVSPAAIAYAWIMAHPARPIPLIGTQNVTHIRAAAASYSVALTREEWYEILVAGRGEKMP